MLPTVMRSDPWRNGCLIVAAALLALLVGGCARIPRIDPTGQQILIWDQPQPVVSVPGAGTVAVPAIAQPGLTLTPARIVAPVGTEVLMVAGVHDFNQPMQPGRRVEWILTPGSVGSFLAVGESERPRVLQWLGGPPPQKISNDYAVSETLSIARVITRGTADPADDVSVLPGQAWVTVASPIEGSSYVTAFAPEVQGALGNRASSVIHWVDTRWEAPPSTAVPLGARHLLTTTVMRASSGAPLAGYKVRYEVAGGPPAGFGPEFAGGVELTTNELGQASAELAQSAPAAGVSQINVDLVRPAGLTPGSSEALAIGSAVTQITWGDAAAVTPAPALPATPLPGSMVPDAAVPPVIGTQPPVTQPGAATPPAAATPQLAVQVQGPDRATVGQQVAFRIDITNRGTVAARNAVVLDRFDAGFKHDVAASPIKRELGEIAAGQTRSIKVTFTVVQPGRQCHTVEVTAEGAATASTQSCLTAVAAPGQVKPVLSIRRTGAAQMKVGDTERFGIEVTNEGAAPVANFQVAERVPQGLQAVQATDGKLTWQVAQPLLPGKSLRFEVEYMAQQTQERTCAMASVTLNGAEVATQEHCLAVLPRSPSDAPPAGQLKVSVADSADPVPVGATVTYRVVIRNEGKERQRQVAVAVELPKQIDLMTVQVQAPVQSEFKDGAIVFRAVVELAPNETVTYQVQLKAPQASALTIRARATSQAVTEPITAEENTTVFGRGG